MLNSVFRHRDLDLATNQDLCDLVKSFDTSREHRPPSILWNLDVVFCWLSGPLFEPLHTSSLRDLMRKTLFLVGLVTAKRVSDLQALDKQASFSQGDAVCMFTLGFLAKNGTPAIPWPRSFSVRSEP